MSNEQKYSLGMIGLGTMGRNLLLNMADHGHHVTGYNRSQEKLTILEQEGAHRNLKGFTDLPAFIQSLAVPRTVMLLVPAGKPVDDVIEELLPLMEKGDLIIDAGNSHFTDTNRRFEYLNEKGLHFFGMGVSGGEEGARRGPSIMPGGDKNAYKVVEKLLADVSAKVNGEPCVTYLGPGAAGHFVKMTHNGIEYAHMQLLAESYEIMRNGLGLGNDKIQQVFESWNNGRLQSFLVEITKDIFKVKDPETGNYLVDMVKDVAKSKGTGKWTSQVSMELETAIPSIDSAVASRELSKIKNIREQAAQIYGKSQKLEVTDVEAFLADLEAAFFFSMISIYAQGMNLLAKASATYGYELNMADIAKIWRGGCIIRSAFLENIYQAYHKNNQLSHLLLDAEVAALMKSTEQAARNVLSKSIQAGIAVANFSASVSYFDAFRTANLPSNLIQSQRDFFGAHTYERTDREGIFHSEWK